MNKALLSLNFMYCMERFATQIYRTQKGAFKDSPFAQKLAEASLNERIHYKKLWVRIKQLEAPVYPFGPLFQFAGLLLGWFTRLSGRGNLFKADIFVETRAVKDYNSFLKAVPFDAETVKIIQAIIADEEVHIFNWTQALESLAPKEPDSV